MSDHHLPEFVEFLLRPESYPHEVGSVELVQTHISYVFLAGNYVYKFKKPMDFGFLNFSTLARRKYFCEQELVLNRRLCPTIYLDVVAVFIGTEGLNMDGHGQPVEYGIRMRRMPEDRMMINLIAGHLLTADMIERIVHVLAPFYKAARSGPDIDALATAGAVGRNILENLGQIEAFVGREGLDLAQFETIRDFSLSFLGREDVFQRRISQGRIREGHGDLYSANICVADEIYIFDCIEFNERYRSLDVASDIAFLAMDLDFHGLGGLSNLLVHRFATALHDHDLFEVLNFYKCYRAVVRGKIGLLTAHEDEVDPSVRERSLDLATRYFGLAAHYAAQP